MFYHDNQSKCLFLISLCSLRHNTWIYISSIDKPLYSILYLLNFPVAWKKCPAFSLLFYPYYRGFGNYANVYRLNYRLLSANIWCMLLYLENLFFEPRSEVFWVRYLLYCDARKKDFDASNKPSQCFKWTIAMVYSLYFDALSTDFMCSVFIEDKTWINRDIEQRSL